MYLILLTSQRLGQCIHFNNFLCSKSQPWLNFIIQLSLINQVDSSVKELARSGSRSGICLYSETTTVLEPSTRDCACVGTCVVTCGKTIQHVIESGFCICNRHILSRESGRGTWLERGAAGMMASSPALRELQRDLENHANTFSKIQKGSPANPRQNVMHVI